MKREIENRKKQLHRILGFFDISKKILDRFAEKAKVLTYLTDLTIFCPFLPVTFFDSIKQATADTAEPILTRDSSYDVSS